MGLGTSVEGIYLVLKCISFFWKKQMHSLEALYWVRDPYLASVGGIRLVLRCCFRKKQMLLLEVHFLGKFHLQRAFPYKAGAKAGENAHRSRNKGNDHKMAPRMHLAQQTEIMAKCPHKRAFTLAMANV